MTRLFAFLTSMSTALIACTVAGRDASSTDDDLAAARRHNAVDAGDTSDAVKIIVEPSDDAAALVSAINGASRSVHMTMYELSSTTVLDALLARHQAGVEVKVVLNSNFLSPPNPSQASFAALQKAGVPVVWAQSKFEFTHEKCVVLDGTTAWIMTMNASKTSPVDNREYLAIDTNAPDVTEAEAQFAADFAATEYTPTGPLLMSPVTMRPGLDALIASAAQTIDLEVEELSDPGIAEDLCAAAGRKVTVRVVLSTSTPSSDGRQAIADLKGCGVSMASLAVPYIHAKAIVVDDVRTYVGSANFSTTSLDDNRELGLIITNPTAIAAVEGSLAEDIANATAL